MTMYTTGRTAYFITNAINPQVGISLTPQLTDGGAPFTLKVNLYAGKTDSSSPVVDSVTLNFTDSNQSISLAGGGVKANGFFNLENNVVYMDAEFDNGSISCNIVGPVAGYFYPDAGVQLTTPFSMRAGAIGVPPNLQLSAAIVGGEMQASYNFEGVSGSVKIPGIDPVPVEYNENGIAISGNFNNFRNSIWYNGVFVKTDVIQVGFMAGVFGCMATPSA